MRLREVVEIGTGRRGKPCNGQHSIPQASITWQGVCNIIKQIYIFQVGKGAICQIDAPTGCECDTENRRQMVES
jgi:hypothetical protein